MMRRILGAAIAIGAWTSSHRIIASLAAVVVLAAIVGGSTLGVVARQSGLTEEGTSAPGSHKWFSISDEEAFCASCHNAIRTEVDASSGYHANDNCLDCHGLKGGDPGHIAKPAKCADCHLSLGQVDELSNDAHASFMTALNETTPADVSWSCKACHTEVRIAITEHINPDLPLEIGPTYP